MKRTWKRFAVLAGCAALSLMSSRVQAAHHRPVSAYQCPHLERQKCEQAATELAQFEPAPGEAATPVDSNVPAEQSYDYEAGAVPSESSEPSPTPAVDNPIPAAAAEQVAPVEDASELAVDPAEAGNIIVFELTDESEGLEPAAPAEIAVEIDYEAEVAREAMANEVLNQIGEAMRQAAGVLDIANLGEAAPAVDTNDPAPAPPAELTDAAPVAVESEAESPVVVVAQPVADQPAVSADVIVEPARAVEAALVNQDNDEWGYARWLASELVGELNRLAIHEAGELAKSAGASIQDVVENGTIAEEASAIEVVAEPETQAAPDSAATVSVDDSPESASPESAVGVTATVQEIPVAEPVTENAQPKADVLSQPAHEESSEESGESAEETVEESKPTSFLPETLEDFENGYSIPDLF